MADSEFSAQTLTQTALHQTAQRFGMTFENANGEHLTVTLPARIAAAALVPLLAQLGSELPPQPPGMGEFSQNVTQWRIGRDDGASTVTLALNDGLSYAMTAADALQICQQLFHEARIASHVAPPMQRVTSWQVSRSELAPEIQFAVNDEPFAFTMSLPTAVEFCVAFWKQAQAASQWKPPTRQ